MLSSWIRQITGRPSFVWCLRSARSISPLITFNPDRLRVASMALGSVPSIGLVASGAREYVPVFNP